LVSVRHLELTKIFVKVSPFHSVSYYKKNKELCKSSSVKILADLTKQKIRGKIKAKKRTEDFVQILKVKPTLLSFYISELKLAGYLDKVKLRTGWEAKIKKILKEIKKEHGEAGAKVLVSLLVKYFEDIKKEFPFVKEAHYPYPHPNLLLNSEIIDYLKSFSKHKLEVNVYIRERLIKALSSNEDELEKTIKEVAYEGHGYEELRNAFISACKYLSISPKSEIARRGFRWINLYSRRQDNS